jgi:hypothetical protein
MRDPLRRESHGERRVVQAHATLQKRRSARSITRRRDVRDEDGRVADFHCLRHAFIGNLLAGGVHPKNAPALARHSTIMLTMGRHSHTVHGELSAALDALPDLGAPQSGEARATGTDGAGVTVDTRTHADSVLAACLSQNGRCGSISIDSPGRYAGDRGEAQVDEDACLAAENCGENEDWRGGRGAGSGRMATAETANGKCRVRAAGGARMAPGARQTARIQSGISVLRLQARRRSRYDGHREQVERKSDSRC